MTTVTNHDVLTLFRRATAEFATRAHSIGDRWRFLIDTRPNPGEHGKRQNHHESKQQP